jgi:hypothetical protein
MTRVRVLVHYLEARGGEALLTVSTLWPPLPAFLARWCATTSELKVLDKSHLDLTTPLGRGFIAFLSAMAEDERHRIVKRANEAGLPRGNEAPGSAANRS